MLRFGRHRPGGTPDNSPAFQRREGRCGERVPKGRLPHAPKALHALNSPSLPLRTLACVRGQAEHHQKLTYQQEFLASLKKHRIPYGERYLWT